MDHTVFAMTLKSKSMSNIKYAVEKMGFVDESFPKTALEYGNLEAFFYLLEKTSSLTESLWIAVASHSAEACDSVTAKFGLRSLTNEKTKLVSMPSWKQDLGTQKGWNKSLLEVLQAITIWSRGF